MVVVDEGKRAPQAAHVELQAATKALSRVATAEARAAAELYAAASAFEQAHVLFDLIKNAVINRDLDQAKTLARIGSELTCNYGNRAEDEAEYFEKHGRV